LVRGKNFCPFAIKNRAFPQFLRLRETQTEFFFLLKEKIVRKKIKKCRENFSVLCFPYPPAGGGGGRERTSLFWILFKESSNIVRKTPQTKK